MANYEEFHPGDTVERIDDSFNGVVYGKKYIVRKTHDNQQHMMYLEGISGERPFAKRKFKLIERVHKFQIGDVIELVYSECMAAQNGATAVVNGEKEFNGEQMLTIKWVKTNQLHNGQMDGGYQTRYFILSTNKGEQTVNKTIAKLFDKTADAMLVNKHLGGQIADSAVTYIVLNGKQKELLAEAQRREDEINK